MVKTKSRTYRSMQNSIVGLVFYFANLALSFVSRKVYIDYLGTELLGLNTTAQNLLGFLNIAELGIGSAIACTLYKPLFDNDKQSINEIVSLQGWLYRRIAMIVGGGAVVLMAFFPLIFAKSDLPLSFAYLSFGVFLLSSLLSYFINYQSIVLSANQKDYLIKGSYSAVALVKIVFQILAVRFLPNPYIWWCALEVVFAFLASFAMHLAVKKDAPYLNTSISAGKELRNKYPEVITKVKQLFFHKIGGFVVFQSQSIIMYAFTSLSMVALVGNYTVISWSLQNLIKTATGNIGASVGNLVAEGDSKKTMKVFEELFSMRFLIAGVVCSCTYLLSSPFITLWLGGQYILPQSTVFLIVASMYLFITRTTVDDYINAKGLFQDIWAPIAEAIIYVSGSLVLGHFYGLNGVLLGGLISQLIIIFMWKPYFLFSSGLKESIFKYIWMYGKHLVAFVCVYLLSIAIINIIPLSPSDNILSFLICGTLYLAVFAVLLFSFLYCISGGMRFFTKRILDIIRRNKA